MVRSGFRTYYILVDGTISLGICVVAHVSLRLEELVHAFVPVGTAVVCLSFAAYAMDFRDDHDACSVLSYTHDDASADVADSAGNGVYSGDFEPIPFGKVAVTCS